MRLSVLGRSGRFGLVTSLVAVAAEVFLHLGKFLFFSALLEV
jgi:hypothetical protein